MRLFSKKGLFAKQSIGTGYKQAPQQAFVRDEDGATTIEFVLLAAPFFGFLYSLLAIGYIYLNATILDDSTQQAGRKIRTGEVASSNLSKDEFKEMVCSELLIPQATCLNDLVLDVTSDPDLSQLDTDAPTSNGQLDSSQETYDPGDASDYVIVKAYLPLGSMSDLFALLNSGTAPEFILSAVEVFRNEPFQ
nr:TadE/TadG family type IV pilus assembly protein [uncultured Cohaesibacter sp.]